MNFVIEEEEDVIQGERADQVKEEPGPKRGRRNPGGES